MWKRKWKLEAKEAVTGYTASNLTIHIERQKCGTIFLNIRRKVNVSSIVISKETFSKACDSLRSRAASILSTQKMNYGANQLIF